MAFYQPVNIAALSNTHFKAVVYGGREGMGGAVIIELLSLMVSRFRSESLNVDLVAGC